jgi:hypothetical protein
MAFSEMTDDLDIIAKYPDEPYEEEGYTSTAFKASFDRAGKLCKAAHNVLVRALNAVTAAANVGFSRTAGVPADNVQAAVENVQQQLAGVALDHVPDASIGNQQMVPGGLYVDIHEVFEVTVSGSTSSQQATVNYARKYPALGIVAFSVRALAEIEAGDSEFVRFMLPSSSTIIPGKDGVVCAAMESPGSDFDWELRISGRTLDAVAKGGYSVEAETSKTGWVDIAGFYAYH